MWLCASKTRCLSSFVFTSRRPWNLLLWSEMPNERRCVLPDPSTIQCKIQMLKTRFCQVNFSHKLNKLGTVTFVALEREVVWIWYLLKIPGRVSVVSSLLQLWTSPKNDLCVWKRVGPSRTRPQYHWASERACQKSHIVKIVTKHTEILDWQNFSPSATAGDRCPLRETPWSTWERWSRSSRMTTTSPGAFWIEFQKLYSLVQPSTNCNARDTAARAAKVRNLQWGFGNILTTTCSRNSVHDGQYQDQMYVIISGLNSSVRSGWGVYILHYTRRRDTVGKWIWYQSNVFIQFWTLKRGLTSLERLE